VTGYDNRWGDGWRDEPPLTISVTHCDDGVVVQARGEIDLATRDDFEQHVLCACGTARPVWLDLADIAFLDPQGARLLRRLQGTFDNLHVASASAAVHRVTEIVDQIDGATALADPNCDVASA
jgi:anti-anti-sigma factor